MNEAMFHSTTDEKLALTMLNKAMTVHRSFDNIPGLVKCMDNLVQLYVRTGDIDKAETTARGVLKRVTNGEDYHAIQHASMNMGIVLDEQKKDWEAAKYFRYALECHNRLSNQVKHVCINRLSDIYKRNGNQEQAELISKTLILPRSVNFVLDVSASMYGPYIETCRSSIIAVMDSLGGYDEVSLWVFNHQVRRCFPLTTLAENRDELKDLVMNDTNTDAATAFYDAIVAVSQNLTERAPDLASSNAEPWVVALTDGSDTDSKNNSNQAANAIRTAEDTVLKHSKGHIKFKFIVITVGELDNMKEINHIVHAVSEGLHIGAANGDVEEVTDAFKQVKEMLTSNLSVESL